MKSDIFDCVDNTWRLLHDGTIYGALFELLFIANLSILMTNLIDNIDGIFDVTRFRSNDPAILGEATYSTTTISKRALTFRQILAIFRPMLIP